MPMHIGHITSVRATHRSAAPIRQFHALSVPAVVIPRRHRRVWGVRVQPAQGRYEPRESTEPHARECPVLKATDRRLRKSACPRQVPLRPSEDPSAALDHPPNDLPAKLHLGFLLTAGFCAPHHGRTISSSHHQGLIRHFAAGALRTGRRQIRWGLMRPMCIGRQGWRPIESVVHQRV